MRPFQFIEELKPIADVKNLSHLIKINDFVYGLVPWTAKPSNNQFIKKLDNHSALNWLYILFKEKRIGGWCGLNANVLQRICRGYDIPYKSFNYGLNDYTHIVGILKFKKSRYLFDPYFSKHYVSGDHILTFDELMELVQNDDFDSIQSVYGNSKKAVIKTNETVYMKGQDFEKEILRSFVSKGLNEALLKTYGNTNPFNMMKKHIGDLDGK